MKWKEWLREQVEKAARRWYNLAVYNPYERYYLWYKRGGLTVCADQPGPDWELGHPERNFSGLGDGIRPTLDLRESKEVTLLAAGLVKGKGYLAEEASFRLLREGKPPK